MRGPVGRPRTRPGAVAADKAYSSRANRAYLRRRRIRGVIPEKADQVANRKKKGSRGGRPVSHDPDLYQDRNTVERTIGHDGWSVEEEPLRRKRSTHHHRRPDGLLLAKPSCPPDAAAPPMAASI